MTKTDLARNIAELRKQRGLTQEQLAETLNISPQAVSKWETAASLPDTQTLPLIAEQLGVSIDYLFYGQANHYDDLYPQIFRKVAGLPQMCEASYREALAIFASAHHGISRGNLLHPVPYELDVDGASDLLLDRDSFLYDDPAHISDAGGVSLLSGRGFGAIVTRQFFEHVGPQTAAFGAKLLAALSDETALRILMAICSMSDISFHELAEKLALPEEKLREGLSRLISAGIVEEKVSKHAVLGTTYDIHMMYHSCLCILLATLEMQRLSLGGVACCMGPGDYPISL